MVRIVLTTDPFFTYGNGIASSVMNAARELANQGHDILILVPRGAKHTARHSFTEDHIRLVELHSLPSFVYPNMRVALPVIGKAMHVIREFRADVIHIHTPLTVGICGLLAGRHLGIPVVSTNHIFFTKQDTDFFRVFSSLSFVRNILGKITRAYLRWFYNRCALVLAPSAIMVREMQTWHLRPPITIAQNPLSSVGREPLSDVRRAELRKRWGLTGLVIVHCGRISEDKSVDVLIKAFAKVQAKIPSTLLMIGDGPSRTSIEQLACSLHIHDRIVWTGMLPHAELIESGIVGAGDLFVTASTMESQSMAVMEAMACGLPIIGVKAGGVTDLIEHVGILSKPFDDECIAADIEHVLRDDNLRQTLSHASFSAAQQYAAPLVVKNLLEHYSSVISRST